MTPREIERERIRAERRAAKKAAQEEEKAAAKGKEEAGKKTGKSDQASQPATIMSPIVEAPTAPVSGPHPGSRFDLSHWKLTLPINVAKTYSGHASEIGAGQLASGFKDSHFQTDTEGAMVFWCPVIGSTTEGTEFPRCELREMLEPGNPGHNWKIKLEDSVLSVDVNGVTQTENMIQHDESWARQMSGSSA